MAGAERKHRYDRRERGGSIYFRGDLPHDLGEWLIHRGYKADDDSTDPDEWGGAMVRALRWAMRENER